jgi:predicted amidophosphoribosyltransferase
VHRLKFSGWRAVAAALAAAMVTCPGLPEVDAVTWVPLARRRLAERGYDQARALAAGVSDQLGVPAVRTLRRAVASGPQARRAGAERREALRGAFRAAHRPPPRVLLVDDVLTTGSTAAACAAVLRDAGAVTVALLTATRSFHGALRPPADPAYPRVGPRPGLWLPGDPPR